MFVFTRKIEFENKRKYILSIDLEDNGLKDKLRALGKDPDLKLAEALINKKIKHPKCDLCFKRAPKLIVLDESGMVDNIGICQGCLEKAMSLLTDFTEK